MERETTQTRVARGAPTGGLSAAAPAFYRVLLVALVAGILIAAVFVVRAALIRADVNRGPRSFAEKNIVDAEAAVRKDPRSADARLELGKAYAAVGRYGPAIKQLQLAERIDRTKAEVPYFIGAAYRKSGDYANAVSYLKKAAAAPGELGEFYANTYFELGQTHYDSGEYKKAIEAYEKALDTNPLASDIMFELGRSYEGLGDKKEAVSWYKDALVYEPRYTEVREALARLGVKEKEIPQPKSGGF